MAYHENNKIMFMNDMKLRALAERCESKAFLNTDPSFFMHQVDGVANRETTAFVASCLSYGSRKQFMPKIGYILDLANGDLYTWVKEGLFLSLFSETDTSCFYRLYTHADMNRLFSCLKKMLVEWGTIGNYVKANANDGLSAVDALATFFASNGASGIIPKNVKSPCKRLCMFLRWMVRDNSSVDLGLWSSFIDKRSLIIPMDTHVRQEAVRLGLMSETKSVTMKSAILLTKRLAEIFPEDPLKADFALFGPVTLEEQ